MKCNFYSMKNMKLLPKWWSCWYADDDSAHKQSEMFQDLRKLNGSENVYEKTMEQCINEDSKLEWFKVLSDGDIVLHVTCGSEEKRKFKECFDSDDKNLITNQKLSHGGVIIHWGID